MKHTFRSGRVTCLLLGLVLLLAGCIGDEVAAAKGPFKSLKWKLGKEKADGNSYLEVSSKSKDFNTSGYLGVKRNIHPPFRWEVTAGLFGDADEAALDQATFGTELDTFGNSPFQFWGISAQVTSGGLNVYAASHKSAPGTHGTRFFDGARILDLAIEHDGSDVIFLAREHGETTYETIASVEASGAVWPVFPAVGVTGLKKGKDAEFGFDNMLVVHRGAEPAAPGMADEVRTFLGDAIDGQTEAMHTVDGAGGDAAAAKLLADATITPLDDAIGQLQTWLVAKKARTGPEPALKLAEKARKKLDKAIKKLDKGKVGKSSVKALMKVIQLELLALEAIEDE